jgi:hypothetical protein
VAKFQVGERVKLRSGRFGTILAVLIDSSMAMNARYRVDMEPGHQLIGVNGLDVMELLPQPGALPPNVARAVRGIDAFARWPAMHAAMLDVDEALVVAGVQYVVQGSAAALLHGASVSQMPGDIDICVDRLQLARDALVAPLFAPRDGGSALVRKYAHQNGTEIDVVDAGEFGVNLARRSSVQGVWILSLDETLTSILLRPEIRRKEMEAFNSLILLKGAQLSAAQREAVVTGVRRRFPGTITTWQGVVDAARGANAGLNLGI